MFKFTLAVVITVSLLLSVIGKPPVKLIFDTDMGNDVDDALALAVVMSGFEIGISLPYPARSILNDFNYVKHHPISAAYQLYMPTPHERPTWDLTSVLHGVRPDRNYFGLSPRGRIKVHADGYTEFIATESGNRQFLTMTAEQRAMTLETLVNLSSQPPTK